VKDYSLQYQPKNIDSGNYYESKLVWSGRAVNFSESFMGLMYRDYSMDR